MAAVLNTSFLTNLAAAGILGAGFVSPLAPELLKSVGVFALSGGITNWLAIHMLFEKVPGLYGSGVIPNRFGQFKMAIKDLLMQQFFRPDIIDNLLKNQSGLGDKDALPGLIRSKIDLDKVFDGLGDAIMASSFGNMLSMMGGKEALEPLRLPVQEKLHSIIQDVLSDLENSPNGDKKEGPDFVTRLHKTAEHLIDQRLAELTPGMVKEMVKKIINRHLGWLVIWGALMGGCLGGLVHFIG